MDDTIRTQEAIDAITDERIVANMDSVYDSELHRCKRAMQRILASLPSAQPERKRGRWIKADTHNYLFFKNDRVYKCDICRKLLDFEGVNGGRGDANFCPNCGADMRGENNG